MIRLGRTFVVDRVDVPRLLAMLPALLQCLRDLKFGDDGAVRTADGRALEGLRVTDGSHPRTHTSYSIVTQAHTEYAVELVADDSSRFQLRGQGYDGTMELLVTLPDPGWPKRVELALRGFVVESWPMRGAITGSATIALDQFPPAHRGKPQATAKFRHRRLAGQLALTVAPDTGDTWRATVDIRLRPRGIFRLIAPFSGIFSRKLQRPFDDADPAAVNEFIRYVEEKLGAATDPPTMAAAAVNALLDSVAEEVPDRTRGTGSRAAGRRLRVRRSRRPRRRRAAAGRRLLDRPHAHPAAARRADGR